MTTEVIQNRDKKDPFHTVVFIYSGLDGPLDSHLDDCQWSVNRTGGSFITNT